MPDPDLVIFADDRIVVANKHAGLLTTDDGSDTPSLRDLLEPQFGPLMTVHRLDRDTSGVNLFARDPMAHRVLSEQFEKRLARKTYWALVHGVPVWEHQVISAPLATVGRANTSRVDPEHGKASTTQLQVLESFGRFALLGATPAEGRTHQIRIHLKLLGHPICGDAKYQGLRPAQPPISRLALHAKTLHIAHPGDASSARQFEAPLAADLDAALRKLRAASKTLRR